MLIILNNIQDYIRLMAFFGLIIIGVAVVIVLGYRWHTKKIMKKLDKMLDAAICGDFTETTFNESLQSSIEAKIADYLAASEVSAKNLQEEKDKIKTLIADISHQTKTPVANILLYTQLLSEQELPEESQSCVEALESQASKLQSLIDALVKTSRLETGIIALHPEKNQIQPVVESAVKQFLLKAEEKAITLSMEPTTEHACFDLKWTNEALSNLVDNAIKYTPEGGKVRVSVTAYDLFCRIDVSDNGVGILEEEQPKIFGRFYRGVSQQNQEGVGIGLYLVRQIANGQGGYVKVSSNPEEGSKFSLFLPKE